MVSSTLLSRIVFFTVNDFDIDPELPVKILDYLSLDFDATSTLKNLSPRSS